MYEKGDNMSNPDDTTDKDRVWHDSYNKEDKIDPYENDTDGTANEVYRKVFSKLLIIAAVISLIFVILFVVVFSQSQDLADKKQVLAIEKRLGRLETEFTSLKTEFTALKTYIASKLDQAIQEMERDKNTIVTQKPPFEQEEQQSIKPKVHKVLAGESLSRISRYYGLTIEQLRDYNNLKPNATIYPGQELKLNP
jgi:LysM repeat protein